MAAAQTHQVAPATSSPVTQLIPLDRLIPSPTNPRKHFDKNGLDELAASIRTKGVLQPILARPNERRAGHFEVVAGERRYRAAKAAGLTEIPGLVRELSDIEVVEVQVIENLQRVDLHPLEEAEGYHQLMGAAAGYDAARISERVGRSVKYVYDRLKLLSLTKAAQALFRSGEISAGHAVLLARLTPADQVRAIGKPSAGPLLYSEHVLWTPEQEGKDRKETYKAISVRELQAWIDKNVRFDTEVVEPMLFPETAEVLTASREEAEKIIPITHDHYVTPEAKDGNRTFGPMSWRRADKKPCDRSVTGVIVVGPGRGDAFKVCTDKKGCAVHWGKEQRAAKKRAEAVTKGGKTGEDRYAIMRRKQEEQNKRERAEHDRWQTAAPAILQAVAASVKKAPTKASGQLAALILERCQLNYQARHLDAKRYLPLGSSAEDLVRYAGFTVLADEVMEWGAPREFPKRAKAFGVDVAKILAEVAPKEEAPAKVAKCRKCGCTEDKACVGGCAWFKKPDPKTLIGLCTSCVAPAKLIHSLHPKPKKAKAKDARGKRKGA